MIVMMRARVRQQLEKEILRKEEQAAGVRPCSIEESNSSFSTSDSEAPKRENPVVAKLKGILDISADEQ